MADSRVLPPEFLDRLAELERSYLTESDPIRQSGFGGGARRWRQEREPILEAINRNGSLLDVGCATGYLLECLVAWGAERGCRLSPHGVDRGVGLIARARERLPQHAANLHAGNAWDWQPPHRYDHVYSHHECVPLSYLPAFVRRLLGRAVTPGGRLILGAYGSRSRDLAPFPIDRFLEEQGYTVLGTAHGGEPEVTRFAWIQAPGHSAHGPV